MIGDALRAHVDEGVSVVVGSVSPAGTPHASKGFGVVVLDDHRIQVFLDAGELTLLDNLRVMRRVSVTTGDVLTFQSIQVKGEVEQVAAASPEEHDAALRRMDELFDRIVLLQNVPREALVRRLPSAFATCTVRVDAAFDQTPGPSAGTRLEAR